MHLSYLHRIPSYINYCEIHTNVYIHLIRYISLKPGRPSRKGDNPGDDDLYEMVLRSQVSIKFRVGHLFIQSVEQILVLKTTRESTEYQKINKFSEINSAVYETLIKILRLV